MPRGPGGMATAMPRVRKRAREPAEEQPPALRARRATSPPPSPAVAAAKKKKARERGGDLSQASSDSRVLPQRLVARLLREGGEGGSRSQDHDRDHEPPERSPRPAGADEPCHSARDAEEVASAGERHRRPSESPRAHETTPRGARHGARLHTCQSDLSRLSSLEGFVGLQGFTRYILQEISDHHSLLHPDADTKEPEISAARFELPKMARVPIKLEKTILVGFLVCMDSFLFNFTLLPVRSLFGLADGLALFVNKITHAIVGARSPRPLASQNKDDLIRAFLLVSSFVVLHRVDISFLYHYIRGQMSSYIKLYVIYNVLEVFDKLLCSLGQDILNSMASWGTPAGAGANQQPWYWSVVAGLVACAYTSTHAYILLVQVVTLNVAINSQNNSLITLLVANNFTELKGHVFKKFDEGTLLQVLCADMVERFQMFIFLLLVTVQNWAKDGRVSSHSFAWLQEWVQAILLVFASELGVLRAFCWCLCSAGACEEIFVCL